MRNKLNILYDATILVGDDADTGSRSGIYFVALNLLKELKKRGDVCVTLYTPPCKSIGLREFAAKFFPDIQLLYRFNYANRSIQRVLLALEKIRTRFYKEKIVRKTFTLLEIILSSLYNLCSFKWQFLFSNCGYDVFFSPLTAAPWYIQRQKRIKKYVILYDVIPFKIKEYANQKNSSWFGHLLKHLNENDRYFAISKATKEDFCRLFCCLNEDKIWITHLAASCSFSPEKSIENIELIKKKYKLPLKKKYVFSLCTLEPRKNLIRVVRTFLFFIKKNKVDDLIFVLGGGAWRDFAKKIKDDLENPDEFDKYVFRAGYVADEDLPVLYSNAEWFVYTSQYEGFGLPPLEAMQCGCPVITSNNSSLPEVVGDAGIMIDWDSDEQHVEAYEQYYFDKSLKQKKSAMGLVQATLFSWEKTANKMLDVMLREECAE